VLIPFKVNGIQQVFHIDPQVVTAPAATSGPRTGLGDAQIYNFTLTKQDIGLPEKVTFGIGPLVAVPTNTSTNFGPNSLQGGVAGVIIAPQSWGLLGVLATYQHTLWGASSELTTVQPTSSTISTTDIICARRRSCVSTLTATRMLSPSGSEPAR
jgi:hypothetical protein